jgi:hypothetical protein
LQDHMQVIVQHRIAANADGKDLGQLPERSSIHCLRSSVPSPHRNARRTQREMQW